MNECRRAIRAARGRGAAVAFAIAVLPIATLSLMSWGAPAAGAPGTGSPRPIDACTLLDAAQVSALLGVPVQRGARHDDGATSIGAYSSTCIWKLRDARLQAHDPSATLGGADFAILNVFSWPSRAGAASFLQSFRSAADNHEIPMHPVALDIGDESLWWGDGVAVRRGTVSFGVSVVVNSAGRERRRGWEEALARKILARMQSGSQPGNPSGLPR